LAAVVPSESLQSRWHITTLKSVPRIPIVATGTRSLKLLRVRRADQAGDGPRAALEQAEEGRLAATLRVRVLVDDKIRIGAYPDQARVREDDEDLAVAAGMDLVARLDSRAAREPQDLAAAEHEHVAVRGQHLSRRLRARGQSKRRGAEYDAENPQQTRPARACIP